MKTWQTPDASQCVGVGETFMHKWIKNSWGNNHQSPPQPSFASILVKYCVCICVLAWEQWTPGVAGNQPWSFHDSEERRRIREHPHATAVTQHWCQSTEKLDNTQQLSSCRPAAASDVLQLFSLQILQWTAGTFPAVFMFVCLVQQDTFGNNTSVIFTNVANLHESEVPPQF